MIIRKHQMEAFKLDRERRFRNRLERIVRALYPRRLRRMTDAEISALVERGVQDAVGYGITYETSVADFLGLTLDIGPTFHRHPRIRKILEDKRIPANDRVAILFENVSRVEWIEIADYTA